MSNNVYVYCPLCKGKGKVIDHMMGACGFGLGYLAQKILPDLKQNCLHCGGDGIIKISDFKEFKDGANNT